LKKRFEVECNHQTENYLLCLRFRFKTEDKN